MMGVVCSVAVGVSAWLLMTISINTDWSAVQFVARASPPMYMPTTPDAQRFGLSAAQHASLTNGTGALVINPQGGGSRWTSVKVSWYEITGPATEGVPPTSAVQSMLLGWQWVFGVPAIAGSAAEFGAGSISRKGREYTIVTAPAAYAPGVEVVLTAVVDTAAHTVSSAELILVNTHVTAGEVSELRYSLIPDDTEYELTDAGTSPLQWQSEDVDFTASLASLTGEEGRRRVAPRMPAVFFTEFA